MWNTGFFTYPLTLTPFFYLMLKYPMFFSIQRIFFFIALTLWPLNGKSHNLEPEIKKSQLEIPAGIEKNLKVRVSLTQPSSSVAVSTATPFHVFDGEGHLLFKGPKIKNSLVSAGADGILLGRKNFGRLPITIDAGNSVLQINKRTYRYHLQFSKTAGGKLLIVNEIGLEDYLRGVVPWEANPKWTQESLKAQAVVSRTYALFKIIENHDESFSVSNDVISQVYGGAGLEKESTNRAIEATRGEVLVYQGKIFPAFFHSTCGGQTTRAENVWPIQPHAVLRGVKCGFCAESPHYRWKAEFSELEIQNALKKLGYSVSGIQKIILGNQDESGRARFFMVEYPTGKLKIQAGDLRMALSPKKFKSVLIQRISRSGGMFVFTGHGWGHGVGLCQYGAKQLGELGYTYKQILDFYYPGAEIIRIAPVEAGVKK